MQDTRLPVQAPPSATAGPLRLAFASILGLATVGLLALAAWMLYDILDIYGNLEGEPWEFSALIMAFAAVTATVGMALLKPRARPRLLVGTFLVVALIGAATFGVLLLLM